eukprot:TRINITY_DN3060_c0_g1_i1.p2 TRINITY_DN3060_c0_g1~~TRINITY_DN3060_c0_g1_i1.p2  ORF type:complete len:105 (+),score=11.85 TRINITY_DN3060_c0_g1_i1:314-628(+)
MYVCKAVAVLVPIGLAMVVWDFRKILLLVGFPAFLLAFAVPCVYQVLSIRYCNSTYGTGRDVTPYSNFLLSQPSVTVLIGLVGLAFVCVTLVGSIVLTVASDSL